MSQNNNAQLIVGEWKTTEIIPESGKDEEIETINIGGKKSKASWHFELKKDGEAINLTTSDVFTYVVTNKFVTLGDQKYLIEKLSKKAMVLLEVEKEVNIENYRYSFVRIPHD